MVRMLIIRRNFFRPHMGLDGRTPAEAAGITIHGEDKWATMISNAALNAAQGPLRSKSRLGRRTGIISARRGHIRTLAAQIRIGSSRIRQATW